MIYGDVMREQYPRGRDEQVDIYDLLIERDPPLSNQQIERELRELKSSLFEIVRKS